MAYNTGRRPVRVGAYLRNFPKPRTLYDPKATRRIACGLHSMWRLAKWSIVLSLTPLTHFLRGETPRRYRVVIFIVKVECAEIC